MALKDSFINLNKALRTTLQNVPAVVDTLIRGFDEIGDAAEAEGTYSTTERVVGKWIDGSDVYEKIVNVDTIALVEGRMDILHGISNLGNVITIDTVMKDATTYRPIPYIYGNGTSLVTVYITATTLTIYANTSISGNSAIITVRYTKSAANRAPEDDTKNDGDDEPVKDPDVKTVDDVEPVEELKK